MSEEHPSMEDFRRVIREELRPLWKQVDRHHREIYGHNGTPGLTTRVSANEGHARRMTWHIRAAWTSVTGIIGSLIYKLL